MKSIVVNELKEDKKTKPLLEKPIEKNVEHEE
jgi:hypothetical protein